MLAGSLTYNQIFEINRNLKLPTQPPEDILYNQALSEIASTVPFILPPCHSHGTDGLILPIGNRSAQMVIIHACAARQGAANSHITNLDLQINLQMPYFNIHSIKANREGIWTQIAHTVFLHRDWPIISLDFIAASTPPMCVTTRQPPESMVYLCPADVGCVTQTDTV
jgi:hypothetical protein